MSVRAKFKLDSITRNGYMSRPAADQLATLKETTTISMSPVFANGDPNHENSKFWAASPGGKLELNCVNPAAVAQFELGKEYYIDFTPAE